MCMLNLLLTMQNGVLLHYSISGITKLSKLKFLIPSINMSYHSECCWYSVGFSLQVIQL